MTSSELYHGFGLEGYRTVATHFEEGKIVLEVEPTRPPRCAGCGSADVIGRGRFLREFKTLPIGHKPVVIRVWVQRVECRICGLVRRVKVGFAHPRVARLHEIAARGQVSSMVNLTLSGADGRIMSLWV